jgi:large subunit ribosomal protein L9
MKVILLQEIRGQGGEGDVVEVKRGYAVNYLFPQKLALEASKGNLKQLEQRKHNIARRETDRLDSAEKIQAALAKTTLVIPARVGEEGHLFGSVTPQQIADRLKEELGLEVDRKKIDLHAPIKTAGEHSVTVSIYRDIKAAFIVDVVDESAKVDAASEAEDTDEALKTIADKLSVASDEAYDDDAYDDDANPEALASAAVEVFREAESVINAAAAAATDEALGNEAQGGTE